MSIRCPQNCVGLWPRRSGRDHGHISIVIMPTVRSLAQVVEAADRVLGLASSTLLLLYTCNFGHLALIEVQKDSKFDNNESNNQASNW